jgi:hypothetical protein
MASRETCLCLCSDEEKSNNLLVLAARGFRRCFSTAIELKQNRMLSHMCTNKVLQYIDYQFHCGDLGFRQNVINYSEFSQVYAGYPCHVKCMYGSHRTSGSA